MDPHAAAWWDAALSVLGGARRVADCCFGEPRRIGDVTIIPVAALEVGGGGLAGPRPEAAAFGARLVPAAALVVRGQEVEVLSLDPRVGVARRLLDLVGDGRGPHGAAPPRAADPPAPSGPRA